MAPRTQVWGAAKNTGRRRPGFWIAAAGAACDAGVLARGPGEGGGRVIRTFFEVLFAHFFVNHRMPRLLALAAWHVILPRPTPQPQFLNKIQFRHYAAQHTLSPVR